MRPYWHFDKSHYLLSLDGNSIFRTCSAAAAGQSKYLTEGQTSYTHTHVTAIRQLDWCLIERLVFVCSFFFSSLSTVTPAHGRIQLEFSLTNYDWQLHLIYRFSCEPHTHKEMAGTQTKVGATETANCNWKSHSGQNWYSLISEMCQWRIIFAGLTSSLRPNHKLPTRNERMEKAKKNNQRIETKLYKFIYCFDDGPTSSEWWNSFATEENET